MSLTKFEWIKRNQKWIRDLRRKETQKKRNPAKTGNRTFDVFGVIKIGEVKADSWYEAKHKGEALSNCVVPFKPIKSFVEEVTYDKSSRNKKIL